MSCAPTRDRRPGGWWVLDESELHLRGHILIADIAGWRHERMPALRDTAWFKLAPGWACAILSTSPARLDRTLKISLYTREGVPHPWLVDPDVRTLDI